MLPKEEWLHLGVLLLLIVEGHEVEELALTLAQLVHLLKLELTLLVPKAAALLKRVLRDDLRQALIECLDVLEGHLLVLEDQLEQLLLVLLLDEPALNAEPVIRHHLPAIIGILPLRPLPQAFLLVVHDFLLSLGHCQLSDLPLMTDAGH